MAEGEHQRISPGERATLAVAGPVMLTDAEGRIATVNHAAERMLGYAAHEVIGCRLDVVHDARQPELRARIVPADADDETPSSLAALLPRTCKVAGYVQRWTYVRKDGSTLAALVTLSPLRDGDDAITGFACVSMVMSGAGADDDAVRQAVEAGNEARSRFVAAISHEIRTPMNVVLGMSHLAQLQALSPVVQDYLEKIEGSAKTLLGIFNNVLDFAKIDAGRMPVEVAPFSLLGLVGGLSAMLDGGLAGARDITFHREVSSDLPTYVVGDGPRIQQVLTNLLSNAVKFTPQGQITLALEVLQRKHDAVVLRICVRDTGIGMTPLQLRHAFEPFWRADSSPTRSYGGTGIGLHLSKRLVELMGGKIEVESEPGKGTEFSVILSLAVTDEKPVGDRRVSAPARSSGLLQGLRVLLVEDNSLNQQVFAEFLESLGIDVAVASNGAQAVERVIAEPFDLVLMDLQMPVLDGYGATRAIRALYTATQLPIIALSADALGEDKRECYRAGMNDHIAKPFEPDRLAGVLAFWSGRSNARHEESAASADAGPQALIAPEHAVLRIDGNRALYRSLLAMFLEHHERTPAEVQQLITAQDPKQMKAIAHRLSSEASHLGLLRLAQAAAGLYSVLRTQASGTLRASAEELIVAFEATVPEINAFLSRPSRLPPPPPPSAMSQAENPDTLLAAIAGIGRQLAQHKLDALRGLAELESSITGGANLAALHEVTALAEQLKFNEAAARLDRLATLLAAHAEALA